MAWQKGDFACETNRACSQTKEMESRIWLLRFNQAGSKEGKTSLVPAPSLLKHGSDAKALLDFLAVLVQRAQGEET